MSSQFEFTYISTFAGCGGSSLGYKWAGGRGLLAVEFDANAAATYRANFATPVLERDICSVTAAEVLKLTGLRVGELDVLDGSPPCQGFSTAGKRVLHDPRNSLFREFVRLIEGLQPKVFVMENVSGMVKGKMKYVFAEVMRCLKATGYTVRCQLLNAMYFNVPQSRERLVWIGVRKDLAARGLGPQFPKAQGKPIPLKQVAQDVVSCRSQGNNPWIASDRACCTITKTPYTGIFRLVSGSTREPTEDELKIIGSFPADFIFGSKTNAWERIGNCVPPRFMQAIAECVRDTVLIPAAGETATLESDGTPFPASE
jgi:DNA (cytosine-5)-methyltransferase 1